MHSLRTPCPQSSAEVLLASPFHRGAHWVHVAAERRRAVGRSSEQVRAALGWSPCAHPIRRGQLGYIKTEIKKKAFVLMHARVAPLFWERVGGCHPRGKQRLGEEALGAPMVFWVPQPSVLLGKGSRCAAWGHFTKRHSETLFCQHAGVQSCYQPQKMGEPRTRGTDLGMAQVEPINLM